MELKSPQPSTFELPDDVLKEFYCNELSKSFIPSKPETGYCRDNQKPTLLALDLQKTLHWLHDHECPRSLEKEVCDTPLLVYAPEFSTGHLLFHFDGSPASTDLIKRFILMFGDLLHDSKATIISPSFIPKSKIREEQEIIHLVASSTKETSFIKFNFNKIGDFWSYGVKHNCTLLVTKKDYQADLAKVLFHFYKGKIWSGTLSFFLSV